MTTITLNSDYTQNGAIRWAANVAHEANDELRALLADGVAGVESDDGAPAAEPEPAAEPMPAEEAAPSEDVTPQA